MACHPGVRLGQQTIFTDPPRIPQVKEYHLSPSFSVIICILLACSYVLIDMCIILCDDQLVSKVTDHYES